MCVVSACTRQKVLWVDCYYVHTDVLHTICKLVSLTTCLWEGSLGFFLNWICNPTLSIRIAIRKLQRLGLLALRMQPSLSEAGNGVKDQHTQWNVDIVHDVSIETLHQSRRTRRAFQPPHKGQRYSHESRKESIFKVVLVSSFYLIEGKCHIEDCLNVGELELNRKDKWEVQCRNRHRCNQLEA